MRALLLAYEKTGYDTSAPGRLPDLLDFWSVRRLKAVGADCIKILLYYNPFEAGAINDKKHAWIERVGAECSAYDIPFFLELVGYEHGTDAKSLEYARKKPRIVRASTAEFSKSQYLVDILKVEIPFNLAFVDGARAFSGTKAYGRQEAVGLLREAAEVATKPFIYLSGGVSNAEFVESLGNAMVWRLWRRIGGVTMFKHFARGMTRAFSILAELFDANIRFSHVESSEGRNHPGHEA